MGIAGVLGLWAMSLLQAADAPATAADRITLRDGSTVLGQVANPNDRGKLILLVRRDWARQAIPDRTKIWEAAETRAADQARADRLHRLEEWQRQRLTAEGAADPLLRQIETAVDRLKNGDARASRLMSVALDRREITKLESQPPAVGRLLRLGWRAAFPDVETMDTEELRQALEGRNFPVAGDEPVSIDDLLPIPTETEPRWRLRRAASELKNDRSAWLIRYGDALMPDGGEGQAALNPSQLLGGLGNLTSLMRELTGEAAPADPLPRKLQEFAERGRAGAVVTRLDIAPDFSGVTVESEMWVHNGPGPGDWQSAGKRASQVGTDQIAANAGANLAADPQIKSAFQIVEKLGLGQIDPEMKQRALNIGAATQKALGDVRTQANTDLETLAVELDN